MVAAVRFMGGIINHPQFPAPWHYGADTAFVKPIQSAAVVRVGCQVGIDPANENRIASSLRVALEYKDNYRNNTNGKVFSAIQDSKWLGFSSRQSLVPDNAFNDECKD